MSLPEPYPDLDEMLMESLMLPQPSRPRRKISHRHRLRSPIAAPTPTRNPITVAPEATITEADIFRIVAQE